MKHRSRSIVSVQILSVSEVTIELCDASKKDHPVLSTCVLKHFDDRPLDHLPELNSYELKSKEGVTVAMLQLEIVQLDPTEVAE